jgi:hypothetical protein
MANTTTAPRIHIQAGIPPESLVDATSDTAPDAPWAAWEDAADDAVLGGVVVFVGGAPEASTIVNEIVPVTASPSSEITWYLSV